MAKVNLSALKSARQNEKRRLKNKAQKSEVKTIYKKFFDAIQKKDQNLAVQYSKMFISKLDKLVKTNIIHANNSARHKSKVMKMLHQLKVK